MRKHDGASKGNKLLRLFHLLMLDGRRHFQQDLQEYLNSSKQTVLRLIDEIGGVIGVNLTSGLENRKRWYQIRPQTRSSFGLEFEELRYLSICLDLAAPYLTEQVRERIDKSIFNFSVLMSGTAYADRDKVQGTQFIFYNKDHIDYTPHFEHINRLVKAKEEKLICLVSYKSTGAVRAREYRFAPEQIVCMNNALCVLGATVTEDFQSMRHLINLAIHRIKDVALTDKPILFKMSSDKNLFGLPWHEPRSYRIHFKAGKAANYVRERIWSDSQRLIDLESGDLLLEIATRSESELTAWVRSFGEEATFVPLEREDAIVQHGESVDDR